MKDKIHNSLLAFREAVIAEGGMVVRITLDKKGNEVLRNEFSVPVACSTTLFGIVVDVAKECPTCGQTVTEEKR